MPAVRPDIAPAAPYLAVPLWLTRVLAVVLPVWAAWQGELTIFEVIWVYWIEGWLMIPFLLLRIAAARGPVNALSDEAMAEYTARGWELPVLRTATLWERLRMMLGVIILRGGILLFYLIFIITFVLLQVTQRDAMESGIETMVFRNPWANSVWAAFLLAQTVEIAAHFFSTEVWRTESPRSFALPFDRRTILLHIIIVSTVILHQFFFEGKDYATKGEVAYVALFGFLRLGVDGIFSRVSPLRRQEEGGLPAEAG